MRLTLGRYEDSIADSMWHFSENPRTSISEVEVFCGSVLNKTGTQTRQQRDSSIRLKDETERVMTWIVKLIRDRTRVGEDGDDDDETSSETSDDSSNNEEKRSREVLRLCWACLLVGCGRDVSAAADTYHGTGEMESFRVVAATCLLRELNTFRAKVSTKTFGGGYVGVSARRPMETANGPVHVIPTRRVAEAKKEARPSGGASTLIQPFERLNMSRYFVKPDNKG